jgi:hypothetical protein
LPVKPTHLPVNRGELSLRNYELRPPLLLARGDRIARSQSRKDARLNT